MKNSIFLTFILFLLLTFPLSGNVFAKENVQAQSDYDQKLLEDAKEQKKLEEIVQQEIYSKFTEEQLESLLDFYFNEKNQIVFLIPENLESIKKSDVKKAIEEVIKKVGQNKVKVKEVKHSKKDLLKMKKEVEKILQEMYTHPYGVGIDTENNRLYVELTEFDHSVVQVLLNKYSNELKIEEVKGFAETKARTADWNNLGAGIGIKDQSGSCTTAGVVYKDSTYYLLTAGHCIDEGYKYTYQWDATVGVFHAQAQNNGYDVGLIRITENNLPGGRYASNGLYLVDNTDPTKGYDGSLKGTLGVPVIGQTVCKSGITEGYKCGKVVDTSYTVDYDGSGGYPPQVVAVAERDPNLGGYFAASGDSGGPVFSTDYLLTGVVSGIRVDYTDWLGLKHGNRMYFTRWADINRIYGVSLYTSSTSKLIDY
jgi:hypothetical protein